MNQSNFIYLKAYISLTGREIAGNWFAFLVTAKYLYLSGFFGGGKSYQ
jgi:hypothetical protein